MPRDDLPPAYSTLRAFVAAARRESVRAAADELDVTPSAVSHQIRILEDWVGRQLFVRAARQIQLTSLGRTLFRRLDAALCAIAEAAESARAGARDKSLRISALPMITSNWLVPRLQKFEDLCTKEGAEVAALQRPDDASVTAPIRGMGTSCHSNLPGSMKVSWRTVNALSPV